MTRTSLWAKVRRFLLAIPDVAGAVVALYLFVLAAFEGHNKLDLLPPIAVLTASMAVGEIVRAVDHAGDDKRDEELAHAVKRIEQGINSRIHLQKRPRPDEVGGYARLWGGFTGHYHAYNPSYRMEGSDGQHHRECIDVFEARYLDPRFERARYLFLTQDEQGKLELEEFKKIMRPVGAKHKSIKNKIEVRQIDQPSNTAEVYFGTRDGVPTAIMDARTVALGDMRGRPIWFLVITDTEVCDRLQSHFDTQWESPGAKKVDVFAPAPAPAPAALPPPGNP
jgi:hypothetical protein